MLRVVLQILPGGDESQAREIGRADISNMSELADVCEYEYGLWSADGWIDRGRVTGHRRELGAWRLVRRMLNVVYKGE